MSPYKGQTNKKWYSDSTICIGHRRHNSRNIAMSPKFNIKIMGIKAKDCNARHPGDVI